MKMKIISGLMGFASLVAASLANASTVTVTPSSVDAAVGDTITLTVVADVTDVAGGVAGGGFNLSWDPTVVSLTSATVGTAIVNATAASGGGFFFPIQTASSYDLGFSSCGLASCVGITNVFDMATLTFSANDIGTGILPADFTLTNQGADFADSTGAILAIQPTFTGTTVNVSAVPVPAAVWLFGSGLLGLVGVARRRQVA